MATKTYCDRCDKEIKPAYTKIDIIRESKKKLKWNREICYACELEFEEWWVKR